MSSQKAPVSPVIEFIKVLNEMSVRYGRSELWYDYIDMPLRPVWDKGAFLVQKHSYLR